MNGVVTGFATITVVIALGYLLARGGLLDATAQRVLATVSFHVATPALLVTTLARTDVRHLFSAHLLATVVGVVAVVVLYAVPARFVWRRGLGEGVIGAFSAGYVNAGYLGIPVAAYVLGDAALVAPTLVLQTLLLQPFGLALLDLERLGRRPSLRSVLALPVRNPLTIGSALGLLLASTGWSLPAVVAEPLRVLGGLAIPAVLLAYGVSLRVGPGFGGAVSRAELAWTGALKAVVQPAVAGLAAVGLGVSGPALLAVVVTSALPTAQNIFVHATRYERSVALARDTILVTTAASVPVIVAVAWFLR